MADEPYFTTDELRELPDLSDTDRFSDSRLAAARDWIEGVIERECRTSFVVRTYTDEVHSGASEEYLRLRHRDAVAISSVTVDSVALSVDERDALFVEHSWLYAAEGTTWSSTTRGNVTVTYTAGYSASPPADLKEAAMRGARNWLLSNDAWRGVDSRATAINNEWGNIQIAVAGPDRPTGWPDVDSTIMAWARKVRVPSIA